MPGVEEMLDRALVALAGGDRWTILALVRDHPAALDVMALRMGTTAQAVSLDLATFHTLEFEAQVEAEAARYDPLLHCAAAIAAADRVLDVGCGAGVSTLAAGRAAPEGSALGVELSAALVKRAAERARAARLAHVSFVHDDAGSHPFEPASSDVVISRFGAMYFGHPGPAFANLAAALRPGGRLALVAWRDPARNEWLSAVSGALAGGRDLPERRPGDPGPFGLADAAAVRELLAGAGFADVALEGADEPVCLGADPDAAYAMVSTQKLARDLLSGADAAARRAAFDALRAVLEAHHTADGVLFGASAWVVSATRPARP